MLKVHHIGYAVKNLEQSVEIFKQIGYTVESDIVLDKKRKVWIAFVSNNNYLVELISPSEEDSPIRNYLNKIGNTPYHLCYETKNIDETVEELRKKRFLVVEKPSSAIAFNNQRVAFLYQPKYGLLELLEV